MPPSAQVRTERSQARSERWRLLRRRPGSSSACIVLAVLGRAAPSAASASPRTGRSQTGLPAEPGAERRLPVRHRHNSDATCSRGSWSGARDVLHHRPRSRPLLSVIVGTLLGLIGGYMRGVARRRHQPRHGGDPGDPRDPHGSARVHQLRRLASRSMIFTVAFLFTPIVFRTVRAVDARRGRARLRHVGPAARRGRAVHHDPRDPAQHHRPDRRRAHRARRATRSSRSPRSSSSPAAATPMSRTGATQVSQMYTSSRAARGGRRSSRRWRIASLVIAVNLIADSLEAVYAS